MTLEAVATFHIRHELVENTDSVLRAAGRKGVEAFVLWTGTIHDDCFSVNDIHVPRQTAFRLQEGLCVRVDGEELHRLNVWLFRNQQTLGAQVHSHPARAYHSETDDMFPIVSERGALSLVVPAFARSGLQGGGIAGYRLSDLGWTELPTTELTRLLEVTD